MEHLQAALADHYTLERELGRGGMATVWLARDRKHDRPVALKVLHPELGYALGPERFLREVRLTARLNHPHILPVLDSGEAAGLLWYTMPYVRGESLRDRLRREVQLPLDVAVDLTSQVASALDYAHREGVIHRDLKPDNILVADGQARVADFGVAKALAQAGDSQLTETGLVLGTPAYMAPEQASGGLVDGRADVYALGCVTYEMLAGEPPYTGPSAQAIIAKRFADPVPSVCRLRREVPEHVDAAIRRALAGTPADRFGTAGEFASAAAEGVASKAAADHSADRARRPGTGVAPRWRLASAVLLVVGLLAALAGTIRLLRSGDREGTTHPTVLPSDGDARRPPTIAVVPFENLGPADEEYFAAGMTDEITSRLGTVSDLDLVPSRAVQRYTRSDMTLRQIGQELGIDYLLVGSVRWAGAGGGPRSVRITLELLRARDERQLWSTTYDRLIDDIFEVQSDIARQVTERLGITLVEGDRGRLGARPTENHEAYTLYLKGRYFWNKRTEENIQIAHDYFQQAVDLDPGYALAWVGIADIWIFRGWYGRLAPRETFPKAKSAARKALEFDSTLAEAHASMAHIHFEFDHDWGAAEREYRRAIELNPRYSVAHHWYGGFLSAMGRHQEALRQAESARVLDPLSLIVQTWVGLRYYFAGEYESAIGEYRKALQMDGDFAPVHWHLGWAYRQTGRLREGVAEAEQALALDKGNLLYLADLGQAYAAAGMQTEARATLARLGRASSHRHVSAYDVALIHIALGDAETGLDWLERAYDERSPWVGYLRVDPRLSAVRSRPRFDRLLGMARLNF